MYWFLALAVFCHLACKTFQPNCCGWGWDGKDVEEEEKRVRWYINHWKMVFPLRCYFSLRCMFRVLAHFFKGERRQVLPFQTMAATSSEDIVCRGINTYQYSATENRKQTVRSQSADCRDVSDDCLSFPQISIPDGKKRTVTLI